jgi:stress-induced morphogen
MEEPMRSWIEQTLLAAFPGAEVRVIDTTGGDDHFEAEVVAPQFVGKTMIQQHRMVYAALGEQVGYEIHALALKTRPLAA